MTRANSTLVRSIAGSMKDTSRNPPCIRVIANYPGGSAVAVEQSVAMPIEQEVNVVDKMIYTQSWNTSDGRMLLDVNFQVGVDQDTANVLTQNRVASAQARLPAEVTVQRVTIKKQSPSILLGLAKSTCSVAPTTVCASDSGPTSWPSSA